MRPNEQIQHTIRSPLKGEQSPQPQTTAEDDHNLSNIRSANGTSSTRTNSTRSKYKILIPSTEKDARKLFVGGLEKHVTNEKFEEFFAQFGTVIDSVVMMHRETKRPRGFGFVTFDDPAVALRLLTMGKTNGDKDDAKHAHGTTSNKITMFGRTCEIKASQPKKIIPSDTISVSATSNRNHGSQLPGRSTGSVGDSIMTGKVPEQIQFQNGNNFGNPYVRRGDTGSIGGIDANSCGPVYNGYHHQGFTPSHFYPMPYYPNVSNEMGYPASSVDNSNFAYYHPHPMCAPYAYYYPQPFSNGHGYAHGEEFYPHQNHEPDVPSQMAPAQSNSGK